MPSKRGCSFIGILCVTFEQAFTPVNGTGVVFYVDNGGAIRGVLIWGIPSGDDDVSGGGLEVSDRIDKSRRAEGLSIRGHLC